MELTLDMLSFCDRRYEEIPIAQVKVIYSRYRGTEQFDVNAQSISQVALLKPIRVNDKFLERTGMYELICGEHRLLAHRKLGRDRILAEVVTCSRREAYLQFKCESVARPTSGAME